MAHCVYCQDRSGLITKVCKDCRKLITAVKGLEISFGYRVLLDALLDTGVNPDKVQHFLDADPDGDGSLNQQVTARMTNELMKDLGQPTEMTAQDVANLQKRIDAGESYLDEPDVIAHPKTEDESEDS